MAANDGLGSDGLRGYVARVEVMPKADVLDPQGRAVEGALAALGFDRVGDVRVGRVVTLGLRASSRDEAESQVSAMCEALLANPVTESFSFELTDAEA